MTRATLFSVLAASFLFVGCFDSSFFNSAADHPVGAKEGIPKVATEVAFPPVSEIVDLNSVIGREIPGFPTELGNGSFAHLQGLFSMMGECRRQVPIPLGDAPARDECLGPDDELDASGAPTYACLSVVNCADDPRCADECAGFRGLILDLSIDASFLTTEQAVEVQQAMLQEGLEPNLNTDALSQIRLQFHELELYQNDEGVEVSNNNRYFDFRFGARRTLKQMRSIYGVADDPECPGDYLMEEDDVAVSPDCIVVVKQKYLDSIYPESPQRFDLGSSSLFTDDLKQAVMDKFKDPQNSESPSATLWLKFAVSEEQLYELDIEGAGVKLDVQPEFVINVLEVAAGQL